MTPDLHRTLSAVVFVIGAAGLVACLAVLPPGSSSGDRSILLAPIALLILGAAGGAVSKS